MPGGVQSQEGRGKGGVMERCCLLLPLDAHSHIRSEPVSVSAQMPLMKKMADVDAA